MAYEHDRVTGNRTEYHLRNGTDRGEGNGTLWIVLGAVVLAILIAISFFGGTGPTVAPDGLGGPATPLLDPEGTIPVAPDSGAVPMQPDTMPAPEAAPETAPVAPVTPAPAD